MAISNHTAFKVEVQTILRGIIEPVLNDRTFDFNNYRIEQPLNTVILPDRVMEYADFERRLKAKMEGVWEKLAIAAARVGMAKAAGQYSVYGTVKAERLRRISEVLNRLEHPEPGATTRVQPNWSQELAYVLAGDGEAIPVTVLGDVYCEGHDGRRYAFELKAPLPNSDQSKVSKEKLLKLYAMEPRMIDEAYFALPYNPYRKRELYGWSFPARWFNMREDPAVLIGDEFWDKLAGAGTYAVFVETINEMGVEYKERIYREFLNVEPPNTAFDGKL